MPRQKRTSPAVQAAETRATALCNISPTLVLGDNLSLASFKTKIGDTKVLLDSYNSLLSQSDAALGALKKGERQLADLSERMLKGVVSKFGRDTDEYQNAGGVRKSMIKRRSRKAGNSKAA